MRSSRGAARAASLLGALAVLAVPAGVVVAQQTAYRLLETLYVAVPASVALGLLAVGASRRARYRATRSLAPGRRGPLRTARVLAWAGLYVGVTAALALGVYGVLRWAQ